MCLFLVSNLPEMAAVVREYDIGEVIDAPLIHQHWQSVLAEMLDEQPATGIVEKEPGKSRTGADMGK
jgi:hypothetical protein